MVVRAHVAPTPGTRGCRGASAALLATLVLLAACVGAPPVESPSAPPEPVFPEPSLPPEATAWQRLLARVGAAGQPSRQDALDAFALAFDTLPGTDEPPGADEPPGTEQPPGAPVRVEDGTIAVRWVRHYWESLTPEQQSFADALIRGEVPAAMRRGRAVAAVDGVPPFSDPASAVTGVTDWDSLMEEMRSVISSRLGRDIKATMTVVPLTSLIDVEADQWEAGGWADAKDAQGTASGPAASCTIYIHPSSLSLSPGDARALMAHEVFHCFEMDLGALADQAQVPPWVQEGAAEWAGLVLSEGKSWAADVRWEEWLSDPAFALYGRSYDAHAIYYLLQNSGVDPWGVMDQHLVASRAGTEAAYAVLWQAGGNNFLNTWGSRYVMHPSPQYANWKYVADGLGQVGMYFPLPEFTVTPGTSYSAAANPYAAFLAFARLQSEVVVLETLGGQGLVRDAGSEYQLEEAASVPWCTRSGGCVCPDGSGAAGTAFRDVPPGSGAWAGLTGHLAGVGVTFLGFNLDDFCKQQPTEPPETGECGLICAGSNGDPHLITVDGGFYDFQAAGEFILLRGADGAFELQARQEPYEDSRSVTINTAVVVGSGGQGGDRAAIYAASDDDGLRLLVNGAEVPSHEATSAGEIQVRPTAPGLEITAPDGTVVWILGDAEWGLNVVAAPSRALRERGVGLLGPVGDAVVPALPDGTRVDVEADFRAAVYGDLASGWEVADESSLFDYDEGEGPSTFRDLSIPEPGAPLDFSELALDLQQLGLAECASITEVLLREHCAFDVAVTDDTGFVQIYESTDELVVDMQTGSPADPAPPPRPAPPAPVGGDACGVLTDGEIGEITGFAVSGREPGSPFDESRAGCTWELDRPSGAARIALEMHTPGGRAEFEGYMSLFSEPRMIPGLGDAAFASSGNSIIALKGDTFFHFDYSLLQPADEEALVELARLVLDRY